MAEPSAKRRRVSPASAVNNLSDGQSAARSQPTTPTSRASYQSPTKASLARSHPSLLPRSPARSQNQLRGRDLRMSLLANRSSIGGNPNNSASVSAPHTPRRGADILRNIPATTATGASEGLSAAVTRAFAESRPRRSSVRSPLTTRQAPASEGVRNDRQLSEEDILPTIIKPKLVKRQSTTTNDTTRPSSSEPDLPPTPVQLGLEPPPERSRGLGSSSSPRGSKSGRRRTRLRNGVVTSSPLKPKDNGPEPRARPSASSVGRSVVIPEVPESDDEEQRNQPLENSMPEDITRKQSLLNDLRAQLAKLKSDMGRLESAMEPADRRNIDPIVLQLLTKSNPGPGSRSTTPTLLNPVELPTNPIPHLTLFAPGSLQLTASSKTARPSEIDKKICQIHTLTVSPPVSYPSHIFGAVIQVDTDPQTAQIEKVRLIKWHSTSQGQHVPLRTWVESRLSSRLHKTDVSGLIWGMGKYWEFCVERARTWAELEGREDNKKPATTKDESRQLVRWLAREMMIIHIPEKGAMSRKRKGAHGGASKQGSLLLSWCGELDWTGEVEGKIGISCKGIPENAHGMVPAIFDALRKIRGVPQAVQGVLDVLDRGRR